MTRRYLLTPAAARRLRRTLAADHSARAQAHHEQPEPTEISLAEARGPNDQPLTAELLPAQRNGAGYPSGLIIAACQLRRRPPDGTLGILLPANGRYPVFLPAAWPWLIYGTIGDPQTDRLVDPTLILDLDAAEIPGLQEPPPPDPPYVHTWNPLEHQLNPGRPALAIYWPQPTDPLDQTERLWAILVAAC